MILKTTTDTGRLGEKLACEHLKKQKYKIIGQNFHASHNEIDIIAENKQYIVFVEVKTRTCSSPDELIYGSPASAVTYSKQQRTIAAAYSYLRDKKCEKQPRFDVIEVYLQKSTDGGAPKLIKLEHMESAFTR